jgi:NADPH-dependent 2,4-dienoyl-CoA reductase/sulfur reductase-like enzyme
VVGGDAAGLSAAAEARRGDESLEIVVLERGPVLSYAACGLPYWLGGEVGALSDLIGFDEETLWRRRRIRARTGTEAVAVDPGEGVVRTAGGERIPYDACVVATGARPRLPAVPGLDTPGVMALRDVPSAERLAARLPSARPARVLLVGSGPIGLEVSEALCRRGVTVDLIESAPRLVPALAPDVAAPVAAALAAGCATARCGTTLAGFAPLPGGRVEAVVDGAAAGYDAVLLGTGVEPNAEIAADAGCLLGAGGAVAADRHGRTSVEGVWAAGDCATAWHRVTGRDVWIPLATTANRQGRVAGRDITGRAALFPGVLGSWVSETFGLGFGATGLDVDAAADAGFAPTSITRTGRDRSGYMPDAREVVVRLVWDAPTGRLLGGQTAGGQTVAGRLHALSVAVAAGLTVEDLAGVDLGYVPPLSALRDPLQLAAAAAVGDAA